MEIFVPGLLGLAVIFGLVGIGGLFLAWRLERRRRRGEPLKLSLRN
jgi:hypothetical protein